MSAAISSAHIRDPKRQMDNAGTIYISYVIRVLARTSGD